MARKVKGDFLWWLPAPPTSPDYSTPEAITVCAWAGLNSWAKATYALLKQDGKVYRDCQAALSRQAKAQA